MANYGKVCYQASKPANLSVIGATVPSAVLSTNRRMLRSDLFDYAMAEPAREDQSRNQRHITYYSNRWLTSGSQNDMNTIYALTT
jgi:hypothetical protein